jgi:hypothetical protein
MAHERRVMSSGARAIAMAVATLVALAALAAGVMAVAVDTEYDGHIKGEGSLDSFFGFNVKKSNGERKVKDVLVDGVDFECDGGSPGETGLIFVDDSFAVDKHGEFGGRSHATIPPAIDPRAKVTGKLKSHDKATGTIRLHGTLDPDGQPGVKCDTGTVEWKAEKEEPMWAQAR